MSLLLIIFLFLIAPKLALLILAVMAISALFSIGILPAVIIVMIAVLIFDD